MASDDFAIMPIQLSINANAPENEADECYSLDSRELLSEAYPRTSGEPEEIVHFPWLFETRRSESARVLVSAGVSADTNVVPQDDHVFGYGDDLRGTSWDRRWYRQGSCHRRFTDDEVTRGYENDREVAYAWSYSNKADQLKIKII